MKNLALSLLLISAAVFATPAGMDPTRGYCQTVDPSACGWGANQTRTQVIDIPDHYGSVALDVNKIILAASENNLKGARSARREALQKCILSGGSKGGCQIVVTSRNSCNAVALGDKGNGGVSSASSDASRLKAEEKVMQRCREMGGEKCFIAYSHCSRDPRHSLNKFN